MENNKIYAIKRKKKTHTFKLLTKKNPDMTPNLQVTNFGQNYFDKILVHLINLTEFMSVQPSYLH